MLKFRLAAVLLSPLLFSVTAHAQNSQPLAAVDTYPYNTTGLIESELGQGSGAVVSNPRIVISCAHLVYDETTGAKTAAWTYQNTFYLAWNQGTAPDTGAIPLRGYLKWATYGNAVASKSMDDPAAFKNDFVVHFTYSDIPVPAPASFWENGSKVLSSAADKMITGYPSGLYAEGDPSEYKMHSTGTFNDVLTRTSGRFMEVEGPSTGAGNSGGPTWVYDTATSSWKFAGVLVAGLEKATDGVNMIGVFGTNAAAWKLVSSAITSSTTAPPPAAQVFAASGFPVSIPDNQKTGISIPLTVSGLNKKIATISMSLDITHAYPSDLQILLRSPSGRTLTIINRTTSDYEDILLTERDIVGFKGMNPNGNWTLVVRDVSSQDVGTVNSFSLQIRTQ